MAKFMQVRQLKKVYQEQAFLGKKSATTVLRNIQLTMELGESLALVGASGSGKSTLCRLMLGLESATSGDVLWQGKMMSQFRPQDWQWFRQQVQLVFQDSIAAVNPRQTICQVLAEPLRYLRGLSAQQIQQESELLMAQVGLNADILSRRAGQLSGGQLQRICIARALAAKPKLIALDESLSSLDLVLQEQIIDLLKRVQKEHNTAFLLVTHDLRLVNKFCQRVVVLDQGNIVEDRAADNSAPWQSEMGKLLNNAILPAMPVYDSATQKKTVERARLSALF